MDYRTLGTRHESLVAVRKQAYAVYGVVDDALYLRDRGLPLGDGVYSDAAVGVPGVDYGFDSVGGDVLDALAAGDGQKIGGFLQLPYTNLFVLTATDTFLPGTGPCHAVNLLPMPHKRMQRLSRVTLININRLIGAPSYQFLPSIIQHCRQYDILSGVAFNGDAGTHVEGVVKTDAAVAPAAGKQAAIVVETQGVDL